MMVSKPDLPKFKILSGLKSRKKRVFNDPVMNADQVLSTINGILKKNPGRLISMKTKDKDGALKSVNPLYKFGDIVVGPNDESSFSIPCVILEINEIPIVALPTLELRKALSEIGKTTRKFCWIFITSHGSAEIYGISSIELKKTNGLMDIMILKQTRQSFGLGAGMDKWWEISNNDVGEQSK